ncbi:MAG TPA: lactonase family protein [Candidatus Dormibacteraeota bacterium]|nr:lactonase family protein [Candidatus Dormibacteraeota bacterium]
MKITGKICLRLSGCALGLGLGAMLVGSAGAGPLSKVHTGKGPELVFVGTYTNKTASKGIYALRFDEHNGKISALTVAAAAVDPSFVVVSADEKFLYSVNEVGDFGGAPSGAISAYSIERPSGKLTLLNQVASGGADPCFLSIDKSGKYLFVANYTGGSVGVFALNADGKIGERTAFEQHTGHGALKGRQDAPHAHWAATSANNSYALEVDLGLDQVIVDKFDETSGKITPNDPSFASVEAGAGPRHLAFSPNQKFAYVTNEIGSTVTLFSYDADKGTLDAKQTLGTLPGDFNGQNDTAEIVMHPSGKFLYVSNRGRDSIAIFGVSAKTGILTSIGDFLTRGKTPRNFAIDPSGHYLLAANQETNDIEVFRIDLSTGELGFTGERVEVPAPVDIVFAGQ